MSLRKLKKGIAMRYKAVWVDALEEEAPDVRELTVYEQDDWIDTGLLDQDGNRLYKTVKVPLGIKRG